MKSLFHRQISIALFLGIFVFSGNRTVRAQNWENLTQEREKLPNFETSERTILSSGTNGPWTINRNYCDYGNVTYPYWSLRKFENGQWVAKGSNIEQDIGNYFHERFFTVDKQNDIPYLVSDFYYLAVRKYTEANGWQLVGSLDYITGPVRNPSITIDQNGVPYLAFVQGNSTVKVMKFNSVTNSWELLSESNYPAEYIQYALVKTDTLGGVYVACVNEMGKSRLNGNVVYQDGGLTMDFDVCNDGAVSFGQQGQPLIFRNNRYDDALGDPYYCYGNPSFDHFHNTAFGTWSADPNDPRFPSSLHKAQLHLTTEDASGVIQDMVLNKYVVSSSSLGVNHFGEYSCLYRDFDFESSDWFLPWPTVNRLFVKGLGEGSPWRKSLSSVKSDMAQSGNKVVAVFSNEDFGGRPSAYLRSGSTWVSLHLEALADTAKEVEAEYDALGNLWVAIVNNHDSLILYKFLGAGWIPISGPSLNFMRDPVVSPDADHCTVHGISLKVEPGSNNPYILFQDDCFHGQGSILYMSSSGWHFYERGITMGTTDGYGYDFHYNRLAFTNTGPVVMYAKARSYQNPRFGLRLMKHEGGSWVGFDPNEPENDIINAADAVLEGEIAGRGSLLYVAMVSHSGSGPNDLSIFGYNGSTPLPPATYEFVPNPLFVSLAIDDFMKPYIAFSQESGCYRGSVIKLDSCANTWRLVGNAGIIPPAQHVSLVVTSDGNAFTSYDTKDQVVGIDSIAKVSGFQPQIPTLTAIQNPINCPFDSITLKVVTGNLNGAAYWEWYEGACGSIVVGTGAQIKVTPKDTTTYFVRGMGNAASPCACASITIIVNTNLNTYYRDQDGDGFGDKSIDTMYCHPISGYVSDSTDCNDNNALMHRKYRFYVDADHDGFGSIDTARTCAQSASLPPVGYSLNNTDCSDTNAVILARYRFYVDADNDGYGSTISDSLCVINASAAPSGYSTNHTDCDDSDSAKHQTYGFYVDADGDGFGVGAQVFLCVVHQFAPPVGYCVQFSDCDDSNPSMHSTFSFYVDADGDGFGSQVSANVCAESATTPPTGYSNNSTDCNDANVLIHSQFPFFIDIDHDGFGSSFSQSVCALDAATPPVGFSINNLDCNDSDSTIHYTFQFFQDGDGDGFGRTATANVCAVNSNTPPSGYSKNDLDCNDNDPNIHPGAAEIQNGLDDNCNGVADEGFVTPVVLSGTVRNAVCTGLANGSISLSISGGISPYTILWSNGATIEDLTNIIGGTYTVSVTDQTLAVKTATFTVATLNPTAKPATPGAISGAALVCNGNTFTYSVTDVSTVASYNWTVPTGVNLLSGQGTNVVQVEVLPSFVSGNLSLTATNCKGTSAGRNLTLKVAPNPTPGAITGDLTVCGGSIKNYSIVSLLNAQGYIWSATGATIGGGQGSTSISVEFPQTFTTVSISIQAINACGLPGGLRKITVKPIQTKTPGAISGSLTACAGTSGLTYSIALVSGAVGYNWAASAGNIRTTQDPNIILFDAPSSYTSLTLKVQSVNVCGALSAWRTITIKPPGAPAVPAIFGPTTEVCGGSTNVEFHVDNVAGASSFEWSISAGTFVYGLNSQNIFVTFPASYTSLNVSVRTRNVCGTLGSNKSITVRSKPATQASISGPTTVCPNNTYSFSASAVLSANAYNWTVPSGWNILSGQGSGAVSVKTGTLGGSVKVSATNGCGTGPSKALAVAINCPTGRTAVDQGFDPEPVAALFSIIIFPNPCHGDEVTMELGGLNENAFVAVNDLAGKQILAPQSIMMGKSSLNIKTLAMGIYIIHIGDGAFSKAVKLVVER